MCVSPKSNGYWVDLNTDDFQAITASVESSTGFWRIKATYAPSPDAGNDASRWAYLFWVGPPSADIVPSVAITRCVEGYRITVLDPMELFANGAFETLNCADLGGTVALVGEIIDELREGAMDGAVPGATAFASYLVQIHMRSGDELAPAAADLQELIIDLMPTDTEPN